MKRSFRVATVFTGAAACAVALAPVAEAAPTAPAAPGTTARVAPDASITAGNCPKNASTTALHLYYPASAKHSLPACITGIVQASIPFHPAKKFQSYCGGVYSGYFFFSDLEQAGHYTRGTTRHNLYKAPIQNVSISKITGTARCGD